MNKIAKKVGWFAADAVMVSATAYAGMTLLGCAPVHADDGTGLFLEHVHALGFSGKSSAGGDAVLIEKGLQICFEALNGVSRTTLDVDAEVNLLPKGYTTSDADAFVSYSISDLCPRYGSDRGI
jgi:hypothetical protein